ncbi:MAG: 30S ribosome-binding factor RbfA [Rhodospirillales bacterium]|nr:30S ribosome-binding factor RbfA [Rhodospirillales bacterium]
MVRREAKAPSQRQLRVGEEIRHALAWALERGEVRDPAVIDVPVTVTEVRISPDLKNATAFVMPLGGGDAEAVQAVVDGLNRASAFLRRMVISRVQLRAVPRLSFIPDLSFDQASEIDALFRTDNVARDLGASDDVEDDDTDTNGA